MRGFNSIDIMTQNGWKYIGHRENVGEQYQMTFLSEYDVGIIASVAESWMDVRIAGSLGVLELDVGNYECDMPYMRDELYWMIDALNMAEDNLIKIGMPFTSGYRFSGRNAANNARRNQKLRRIFDLNELEEKAWEEYERRRSQK